MTGEKPKDESPEERTDWEAILKARSAARNAGKAAQTYQAPAAVAPNQGDGRGAEDDWEGLLEDRLAARNAGKATQTYQAAVAPNQGDGAAQAAAPVYQEPVQRSISGGDAQVRAMRIFDRFDIYGTFPVACFAEYAERVHGLDGIADQMSRIEESRFEAALSDFTKGLPGFNRECVRKGTTFTCVEDLMIDYMRYLDGIKTT